MIKDIVLEDLFLAQKPHFDDQDAFMDDLTKRLDAVEYIRQHQEASIRRYRIAMIAAFVIGIISGAITMVFILSTPTDVPLSTFHNQTGFLLWFVENSRSLAVTILTLVMTIGMMGIVSNVQDIMRMQGKDAFMPKYSS